MNNLKVTINIIPPGTKRNHKVKCLARHFKHIKAGRKTADIRYNDRGYMLGDAIEFAEYLAETNTYTGRTVSALISYVEDFGCQFGYVNLSLARVGLLNAIHQD